ncbi:MAG: DNA cytosine methyltransferase [Saprospiraceae bacterium]|nr:DNA cytosine methyltransferase [Saprospiraceae bacterium]
MQKYEPIRVIDLFAGAGGFTLGFTALKDEKGRQIFKPIWANDFNKFAADTYNANFGNHCLYGDIVSIIENPDIEIPQADLVIGGPPCQGFSLLNKNRDGDPRKELWRPYMEVVLRSNAKAFVMENVPQLLGSQEYLDIVEFAEKNGFQVAPGKKLCAANFGVPQLRYRAIIIGSKIGNPNMIFPPKPTHRNPAKSVDFLNHDLPPWRTVRDAIGDLPLPVGTEIRHEEDFASMLHFGRTPTPKSVARYKAIPVEGMNRFDLQRLAPEITPECWLRKKSGGTDLFGRLWWDRPCFTIRTEFFKPEKGRYLHPEQHRPITHREAARLQSFPDDFIFKGTKIEIARQIGNAVPPALAKSIAISVLNLFRDAKNHTPTDNRTPAYEFA